MGFLKISKKKKTVHIGKSAKTMNKQFPKKKILKDSKHTMRY